MVDERHPEGSQSRYAYVTRESKRRGGGNGDEIDLRELAAAVWAGRWVVIAIALAFALAGGTYAFLATEWFQAEVVLWPVAKKSVSGGLAQLGGLAGLAGIDIPSADSGEPVAVLRSKSFVREFILDEKLMPVLYADKWDTAGQNWAAGLKTPPDIRDGVKVFDEKIRVVTEDKKTGLVTLTINWTNPKAAAAWANLLVRRLNERLRSQAISEAQSSIEYLQKEMVATSVVSLQQSIGRVLEGEMQKMALARARDEFAFKIVDEATPPKIRQSPRRFAILILSTLLGCVMGSLLVILRSFLGNPTGPAPGA